MQISIKGSAKIILCLFAGLLCHVPLSAMPVGTVSAASAAFPSIAERFVKQAEDLFSEGKLINPEDNNAYTLFRAAQIIEPDNKAAEAGLNAILIAEIGAVRDIMARAKYADARRHLAKVKSLYPNSDLVTQLEKELNRIVKPKPKRSAVAKERVKDESIIPIDESALRAKSQELVDSLSQLAKNISKTDEGVLIYARSDAQARWIYQQMRNAVPGYRIRGDLRIGEPSIKLLQPFE